MAPRYRFSATIDPQDFDRYARSHPRATVTQSAGWAQVKDNWEAHFCGLYDRQSPANKESLVGAALVLIRQLPLGFRLAYVSRGPLLNSLNQELTSAFFEGLRDFGKSQRCLLVRMDPKILYRDFLFAQRENAPVLPTGEQAIATFQAAGAKHLGLPVNMHAGFQPRLEATIYRETDYQAKLPKRTRKCLRLAERNGVQVFRETPQAIERFISLLQKTEDRQGITLRPATYHQRLLETYAENGFLLFSRVDLNAMIRSVREEITSNKAELARCRVKSPTKAKQLDSLITAAEKRLNEALELREATRPQEIAASDENLETPQSSAWRDLSAMSGILYGNRLELLYAGFDSRFKHFFPQYPLYLWACDYAFNHGCEYVGLGGVEGTMDDGLTDFKSRLNSHFNEYIGEFDLIISPLYPLFMKLWQWRSRRV